MVIQQRKPVAMVQTVAVIERLPHQVREQHHRRGPCRACRSPSACFVRQASRLSGARRAWYRRRHASAN
jgi:hypothetical protein